MSKYLDSKLEEMMLLSMRMKRHYQSCSNISDGSTMLQLEALMYVNENGPVTMKDFSEHLLMSMSSATQLAERLVGNKFLERIFDENDRRVIKLHITKEGKLEITKQKTRMKEMIKTIYKGLSDKDLKEYLRILKLIFK